MAELETKEQALAYLAEMSSTVTYEVQAFPHGWVGTRVLSREQMQSDEGLGLTRLVIDSQTGIIYVYPSWSDTMVAEAFTEFKQTGINKAGRQIYPHQWRITIQRTREDDETIVYQLTAQSLIDPPEPNQEHPLTIHKHTYITNPTDQLSTRAMARAEAESRRNQGAWPETATIQV